MIVCDNCPWSLNFLGTEENKVEGFSGVGWALSPVQTAESVANKLVDKPYKPSNECTV